MIPKMRESFSHKAESIPSQRCGGSYVRSMQDDEQLGRGVGEVDIYVIHAWDANFINMIEALRYSIEERDPSRVHNTYLWIDMFCMNQCKVYVHSEEWYRKSLKEEISKWVKPNYTVCLTNL